MPHQGNPQQYQFRKQQPQQQGWKMSQRHQTTSIEIVLIITEESAAAPLHLLHVCGGCGSPAHTTPFCPQRKQQQQGSTATTTMQSNPAAGRGNICPPMPLKHNQLSELLSKYPDSDKVDYVIQGLIQGFALEYTGQFRFRVPENLPMAKLDPQLIRDQLNKEIALDRMLGPFKDPPFPDLMCSPMGLVPKKDTDEM